MMLGATVSSAQSSLSGQLALEERPGAERHDLASAVVWLEPAGRNAAWRANAAGPAASMLAANIAMRGREFLPHVRIVLAGGTVTFPNQDPFSHNVFSNADPGPFDLGLYRRGASRAATFPRSGVYPIYCNIHSRMVSFVVAVPGPWFTQPNADGRFAIGGVPEGAYTLHVWHERAGEITRPVTVGAGGASTGRLQLDARAYVASPHLNKFGLPYTAIRADRY
jgi:plastocyanin